MNISDIDMAERYLNSRIPANTSAMFKAGFGLRRTRYLLRLLDDPQDKIKIIHTAGTSGKGSTSYLLSLLLTGHQISTGLMLSPHIVNIRERLRLNNQHISANQFVQCLNEIIPAIEKMRNTTYGLPTYFEILTALGFYFFWQNNTEYAVIETGLGGAYDATNSVNRKDKLCVITKIGFDHMDILGNTIRDIAYQKAGIINKNATVITCDQLKKAGNVLQEKVKKESARLYSISRDTNYTIIKSLENNTIFNFRFRDLSLREIFLSLSGEFQVENCSLALAAFTLLSNRDKFSIDKDRIRQALSQAKFFGRFSTVQINDRAVVLDGAHNNQKMKSLIHALTRVYPDQKFIFLIAFKNTKNFIPCLKTIIPFAENIIITSFKLRAQDWYHESARPEAIACELKNMDYANFSIIPDTDKALNNALNSKNKSRIVITGSFYLLSEIIGHAGQEN